MEEPNAGSVHTVEDPRAAAVLRDPQRLAQLAPFLGRVRTVSQVARDRGEHPSTVLRRVQRYLELELLKVVGSERRNGKVMKLYRTVADAFFVPADIETGSLAWSTEWHSFWDREFEASLEEAWSQQLPGWGHQIDRDERGVLQVSLASAPHRPVEPTSAAFPAILSTSHDALYLDFEDAKEMQRELDAVWRKYLSRGGSQRYLARLLLAPARASAPEID